MDACHCKEHSRAAILRQAAAASAAGAGAGLRAIEPGMPLPAGTGLSRRSFLARSTGLALAVFGGSALAPRAYEHGIADAMAAARQNTVLVSVFLDGGLDTLSLLAPAADPTYQALRPTLKLAPDAALAFRDDDRAPVAQRRRAAQVPARAGPRHRHPRDRLLEPEPVALHLAPLLRGRRAERVGPGRLDRPLARSQRARRQPAAGAVARHDARAGARRGADAGRRRLLADELRALRRRRGDDGQDVDEPDLRRARPPAHDRSVARAGARRREPGRRDPGVARRALRQGDHRHAAGRGLPGQLRLREQAPRAGQDAAHGAADPLRGDRRQRRLRHAREPGRRR